MNTGSASGGDGTTPATTGDNRAYHSLFEAEANNRDLQTNNEIWSVECAGVDADTTTVTWDGWVTSSSQTVTIHGDNTTGKYNANAYRMEASAATQVLAVTDQYIILDNVQLRNTAATYANAVITWSTDPTGNFGTIRNCIVYNSRARYGAIDINSAQNMKVYNNIIYNITRDTNNAADGGSGIIVVNDNDAEASYFYNNTIYNCVDAGWIGLTAGIDYLLKNNICYGNDAYDYKGSSAAASVTNLSSDGTGSTGFTSKTLAFTNVEAGTEDFHLVVGDTEAIDKGTDVYSDATIAVTSDIDNDTLTVRNDIGADEYVAAGGGSTPPFFSIIYVGD